MRKHHNHTLCTIQQTIIIHCVILCSRRARLLHVRVSDVVHTVDVMNDAIVSVVTGNDSSCALFGCLLAENETLQNFLDWIKLDGVNERIGARVQKCDDYRREVNNATRVCGVGIKDRIEAIDVGWQPRDGIECADQYHGFDDVGLKLIADGLSGAWSSGIIVARYHACLTTDDHQNAPVTEDEDQENNDVEGHKTPNDVDYQVSVILPERIRVACSINHHGR